MRTNGAGPRNGQKETISHRATKTRIGSAVHTSVPLCLGDVRSGAVCLASTDWAIRGGFAQGRLTRTTRFTANLPCYLDFSGGKFIMGCCSIHSASFPVGENCGSGSGTREHRFSCRTIFPVSVSPERTTLPLSVLSTTRS